MSDQKPRPTTGEPRPSPFRVGTWTAEPEWNHIRRDGEIVKLEPRVMRLLATLAAAPGRPMLRQDLLDKVWPDTHVNEEALSRAVSQLRRALGDDPRAPSYLQTVHKGGYCLIAPVAEVTDTSGTPEEAASLARPATRTRGRRWLWPFLLVLLAGLGGMLLYRSLSPSPLPAEVRQLVPLTSEPGREIDPAVSFDGKRVVYLASTDEGYDLFVRSLDGGAPLRLTRNALIKGHPSWSPGGDRIAFVGAQGSSVAIYLLSLNGGEASKLIELPSWSFGLDWSPDGRTLAFSDASPGEAASIVLLDIESEATRPVGGSGGPRNDVKPAFSPDGKRIAFIRTDQLGRQRVAVVDLDQAGKAELLPMPPQQLRGLDWAPGGEAVIFSARAGRGFGLWRIPAGGSGAPERLAAEGGELFNPSVSRDGRIIAEEVEQDRDVWRVELSQSQGAPLISSTADDFGPAYAPDASRLAFISERSGTPEIWLEPATGEAMRLTRLGGPQIRHISWSHDSAKLAFVAEADETSSILALEVAGGEPVRLLEGSMGSIPIGWGAGGNTLYILAPAAGSWRLEELSIAHGERRALDAPPLRVAAVSADGRSIFAVPAGENKLLHIDPNRGAVRQFRLPPLPRLVALLTSPRSVYLVEDGSGAAVVHRLDLASGAVGAAIRLDSSGGGTLSLDPTGGFIAYTRARETANDLVWTQL